MSHRVRVSPAFWLICGILVLATNLRGPFTAAGPLLDVIRSSFDMGAGQAGFLITLPLLIFCVVSPFSSSLARALGVERVLFMALLVIMAGIALRSLGAVWALFLGTGILGIGIAVANTLIPSLLKRDFPHRITALTAVYTVTMGAASALGSMIVVPLAHAFNWQWALGVFILFPMLSVLVWWPQLKRHAAPVAQAVVTSDDRVWSVKLAWQISLFFGLTSFVYYVMTAWLPSMLVALEYTPAEAGSIHGILQLATACPGIVLVPLVQRLADQRVIAASLALLVAISMLGLQWMPAGAYVWVILFGFSIGGSFLLALSFIGLRTVSSSQAAALSGMVQCVGYLMSATGPILMGTLHDMAGDWHGPLYVCIGLSIIMGVLGYSAGRNVHIGATTPVSK